MFTESRSCENDQFPRLLNFRRYWIDRIVQPSMYLLNTCHGDLRGKFASKETLVVKFKTEIHSSYYVLLYCAAGIAFTLYYHFIVKVNRCNNSKFPKVQLTIDQSRLI